MFIPKHWFYVLIIIDFSANVAGFELVRFKLGVNLLFIIVRKSPLFKSKFLFRIREREAEFQKQVLERDDQIGRLKERLHILSSKVRSRDMIKEAGSRRGFIQL
jgi:hypothetical protein